MFSSFWRRLPVALILVLAMLISVSLIGVQSTASNAQPAKASNAQPAKSLEGPDTPNPTIGRAFGQKVVITATPTGLDFKFSGYHTYWGGGESNMFIGSEFVGYQKGIYLSWNGPTYNYFQRLNKPDNYAGFVSLDNPNGGWSKFVNFQLVVPQVGTSYLTITSNSLPAAKLGHKYLFRFTAHGGKPPYRWMVVTGRLSTLPKGLGFIKTGPKAGTITGIPRVTGSFWVPVIVRDKVGHSAFTLLNQLKVTS
jgi:hypothetical protein